MVGGKDSSERLRVDFLSPESTATASHWTRIGNSIGDNRF